MINWKLIIACVFLGSSTFLYAGDKPSVTVGGLVQLMASTDLHDDSENNIDQMYGRFIATVKGQSDSHLGIIQLMGFPGGFGYDELVGVETADDGTVSGVYKAKPRFLIWRATIESKGNPVDFRLGKQYHATSKAAVFGSYIDRDQGAAALGRVRPHNYLEFHKTVKGIGNTSVMFIANDKNVNTGDLRIRQTIKPNKMVDLALGYRSNVFDKIYESESIVTHNLVVQASASISGISPYVEFAIKGMGNEDANGDAVDATMPISFGAKVPVPGLNTVRVEAEYFSEEGVDNPAEDARSENPLLWALYVDKKIGRYKHQFILWTPKQTDKIRFSWRLTAGF